MTDTVGGAIDDGTSHLSMWAMRSLKWTDVVLTQDETSFGLAMKDPDAARGRGLCVVGKLVELYVDKGSGSRLFHGLLFDDDKHFFRLFAAKSTADLVEGRRARFCGVVTGLFDYPNSGGGIGHAVKLVGMFDLPENGAAPPKPPTAATAPKRIAEAPATPPAPPASVNARCNPPFTVDEKTGRKMFKLDCM